MKIAYFDCFSGASGDMVLGAFLDSGLDIKVLRSGLGRLKLGGYEIGSKRVRRGELVGTKFRCIVKGKKPSRPHTHANLKSILELIAKSGLSREVKDLSSEIFLTIGKAEAKVHGYRLANVRFHEVGNIDSIVDIVGCAIAVSESGIEKFYASEIVLGKGYVYTQVGVLPVPSPAVAHLMRGIPVRMSRVEAELVTPTGAGILRTLCSRFGSLPDMRPERIGYGAGSADFPGMPNMLRIVIGDAGVGYQRDSVYVVETNIDDMSPQVFDYLFDRLFKEGALDVYVTPIQMKKSRPAFSLSVIVEEPLLEEIAAAIFEETTSIGLRYSRADRFKLARRIVKVSTKYGKIRVKIGDGPGGVKIVSPEYDDCVTIARKKKIPFKVVYEEAKRALK
jgi:hypothetical protein